MKNKFALLLLMFLPLFAFAQANDAYPGSTKCIVFLENINAGYGINRGDYKWLETFKLYARDGLAESGHIEVYDVNDIMELRAWDSRSAGSLQYMKNRYGIMLNNGGEYSVECDLNDISIRREKDKDTWRAALDYTVRIVETKTGTVVSSFTVLGKDVSRTGSDPNKAIGYCLDMLKSKLNRYVIDNFRIEGQLLQILEVKKDVEAKTVAINVGPVNGAQKGTKFDVMTLEEIAGRTITNKIGEVKIKDIKADDLSIAEVKKGGKEIKNALDSGNTLVIISCKAGFWD